MKRSMAGIVAMILSVIGSALAGEADPHAATAASVVPAAAKLVSHEIDDGLKEYKFHLEAIGEEYQVKIDPVTGAVFSIISELKGMRAAERNPIATPDAQGIVLAEQSGAEILYNASKRDEVRERSVVLFRSGALLGEYEIDVRTGTVWERELYPEALKDMAVFRTPEEILTTIKAGHPGAQIGMLELSNDDGLICYEGSVLLGNDKYEFEYTLDGIEREWDRD